MVEYYQVCLEYPGQNNQWWFYHTDIELDIQPLGDTQRFLGFLMLQIKQNCVYMYIYCVRVHITQYSFTKLFCKHRN